MTGDGGREPGSQAMDRLWAGWRSSYVAVAGNGAIATVLWFRDNHKDHPGVTAA